MVANGELLVAMALVESEEVARKRFPKKLSQRFAMLSVAALMFVKSPGKAGAFLGQQFEKPAIGADLDHFQAEFGRKVFVPFGRPPGLAKRAISRKAAMGSGTCSKTSVQSTTSTDASGSGMAVISET
jgi:hypothetical protein